MVMISFSWPSTTAVASCSTSGLAVVASTSCVTDVTVDLAAGGTSTVTVTSDTPVSETDVVAAHDEAGDYHLATA